MMVGESSTHFYEYAARWNQQLLVDSGMAAQSGVPMMGFVLYPLVDTKGWEWALSRPLSESILNPAGLLNMLGEIHGFALQNGQNFLPVQSLMDMVSF